MREETQERLREIKRNFRLMMNGVASQSMRDKGLGYHINWGISFPALKQMAAEYGKDYELAIELWKENIRECKILATMIMPPTEMKADVVDLWMSQTPNQEIAEMLAFNLLQYVDDAKDYALKWIATDNGVEQICGYQVLSRLFMKGCALDFREINELIDQAQVALASEDLAVSHAVVNMLQRWSDADDDYKKILSSAFKSFDLGIF